MLDKPEDPEASRSSSEGCQSSPKTKQNITQKNDSKSVTGCDEAKYIYPSSSDDGEMKRMFFNDFVAQAAVANAGNVK